MSVEATTIDQVLTDLVLTAVTNDTVSNSVLRSNYRSQLAEFFRWWHAAGKPEYTRATVKRYMAERFTGEPNRAHRALVVLKTLAREAAYNEYITHQQFEGIAAIKSNLIKGVRRGQRLNVDEGVQLASGCGDDMEGRRNRIVISLMLMVGLRRSESCRLKFSDVKRIGNDPVLEIVGKGMKLRHVAIPQWLYEEIITWRSMLADDGEYVVRGFRNNGKLKHDTRPVTGETIRLILAKQCEAAGVRRVAPHDLRRTIGAIANQAGWNITAIRDVYGHASVTTTEVYIGKDVDLSRPIADCLPRPGWANPPDSN